MIATANHDRTLGVPKKAFIFRSELYANGSQLSWHSFIIAVKLNLTMTHSTFIIE